MSLNIKNEETHRKAKELATLTGKSMAKSVDEAIERYLADLRRNGAFEPLQSVQDMRRMVDREQRIKKIKGLFSEEMRELKKTDPGFNSKTAQDALYDENGLPC